jgi:hypothetical protein
MTQRLPKVGGDDGDWGTILNDFLEVSLSSSGTLNTSAVSSAGAEMTTNKNQPSGYAGLNSSTQVPVALLPANIPLSNLSITGTGSNSNYLRGDGTWAIPNGGSSSLAADTDVSIVSPGNNQVLTYNSGASKWENLNLPGAPVTTVFGRAGTVVATTGDYTAAQVTGALQSANNLSDVSDAGSSRANIHIPVLTPVAAVATTSLSLAAPGATLDSYSFSSGDLILLTAQGTSSQNGLWQWNGASAALTRPTEFASGATIKGRTVEIQNGTTYSGSSWALTTATAGIVIDTANQSWSQIGGLVGQPNGVASLNSSGLVPVSELPVSVANTLRAGNGAPTVLTTDMVGDFYLDPVAGLFYGPLTGAPTVGQPWINGATSSALINSFYPGSGVIAYENKNSAVLSASGSTNNLPQTTALNDCIVLVISMAGTASITVTGAGATWVEALTANMVDAPGLHIWVGYGCSAGNGTFTVTYSGATGSFICGMFSGVRYSWSPIVSAAGNSSVGQVTTLTTPSVSYLPGQLVIAGDANAGATSGGWSPTVWSDGSTTHSLGVLGSGGGRAGAADYVIETANNSTTADFTWTVSGYSGSGLVVLAHS